MLLPFLFVLGIFISVISDANGMSLFKFPRISLLATWNTGAEKPLTNDLENEITDLFDLRQIHAHDEPHTRDLNDPIFDLKDDESLDLYCVNTSDKSLGCRNAL